MGIASRLALAGVVAVLLADVGTGIAAGSPALAASGSDSGPPASPAAQPPASSQLLQFRLPYLEGLHGDPNALNLARPAATAAPLVLFLPATGAVPADYRGFLDTASAEGYSVLGLDYWNIGRSLTRTCGPDAQCYSDFQRNRLDGSHPTRFSKVDAENSILTRFRAALEYLQKQQPHGRWDRYLSSDGHGIRWSRIVVAGHSQGGGESAYISHLHRVRGVLMYSSPVETVDDVSAAWMSKPGATPVSRMYGFDDVHDMYYDRIVSTWEKLGMGDPATPVSVPTGSHVMLSSLDIGSPRESHGRTVSDGGPRVGGGTPRFAPTWRWMLRQVR